MKLRVLSRFPQKREILGNQSQNSERVFYEYVEQQMVLEIPRKFKDMHRIRPVEGL